MRVKVLYFGILKDQFGAAEAWIELPGECDVGELLELLRGRTSNSPMSKEARGTNEQLWRSLAVAVNREYAQPSMVLRDGDEVALLPPVSGGSCGTARATKSELRSQGCDWARRSLGSRRNSAGGLVNKGDVD